MLIASFGVGVKYYYTNSKSFSNGEFHSKCGLELQSTVNFFFSHRRRSCPSVFWNVTDVHFSLRSSVALYVLSDVSAYNSGTIFSGWMYGQSRTWTDPYKARGESGAWFSQTWYKLLGGKEISQTLLRLCPYLRWSHGQTSISSTVKTHTNRGNLMYMHVWESACDDRMKSSTVCMLVKTNYKCTCTRSNPYCDYAKGWSIEETWFDSPQGHLTLHFPNLARPALESSRTPTLSALWAIMVAKRPGRANDYPHLSSAESKNAQNYTSTHTYLHRVVGYEVRERFLPSQDQ
jgi:hypothetical protein